MSEDTLLDHLRKFDTPTIANALEVARGERTTSGFTRARLFPNRMGSAPLVGYARTVMIRSATAFDPAVRRQKLLGYYEYVASGKGPTVSVVQDIDHLAGLGAFWGEVNTTVHWGLGCIGAITNGSMRDLDAMHPQFQCLAGTLSPSHAFVHVVDFKVKVDVFGLYVNDGDLVHADQHGAVVIPADIAERIPAAIDLMARREAVILAAARAEGFGPERLREAFAKSDQVR